MTIKNQPDNETSDIDWVARARALAPVLATAADRIESERRVPADIMASVHEAELFRMCLPRSMGGGEAPPLAVMQTTEAIASADASTAWCLGQGLGCSRSAAFIDPEIAREIFGPPDAILAWGPPDGSAKAVAVDGGYRVTGNWRLASGIMNATWLGPLCPVVEADGAPRLNAAGKPALRVMLLPASSATITDVWQVLGLQGTGSNNFTIDDLFVPDSYTFERDSAADRRENGRLYGILQTTFYGMAFAGVALGIARTALDDFIDLAANKKPSHAALVLRDNPAVQRQVAQAEANLGAARSYLIDRIKTVWESGEKPANWPVDQRARLRLACTHAVMQARDTVGYVYQAAGSSAIFAKNPFERRFRDINTVANQAQGQPTNLEQAGSALLGSQQTGSRI
jgi:alkylation response protein AidB-like acyl-CoA dehydrogenase